MNRHHIRVLALFAFVAVAAASRAGACPVCYGAPDSPSTQGMTAAIFSLLGVTGGVLAAFATMFYRLRRRIRAMAPEGSSAPALHNSLETESHG
jgi:hypothetical protein